MEFIFALSVENENIFREIFVSLIIRAIFRHQSCNRGLFFTDGIIKLKNLEGPYV